MEQERELREQAAAKARAAAEARRQEEEARRAAAEAQRLAREAEERAAREVGIVYNCYCAKACARVLRCMFSVATGTTGGAAAATRGEAAPGKGKAAIRGVHGLRHQRRIPTVGTTVHFCTLQ